MKKFFSHAKQKYSDHKQKKRQEKQQTLIVAAILGNLDVFKKKQHKKHFDFKDEHQQTLLMYAAIHNRVEIAKFLLDEQVGNLDVKNIDGLTALSFAKINNNKKMVEMLCIITATQNGNLDNVKRLIKNVSLETKDEYGQTPLMHAAYYGRLHILNLLLENGAQVESTDNNGNTALMNAVVGGYFEVVGLLLKNNANKETKNKQGLKAIDFARNQAIFDLLNSRMQDMPQRTNENKNKKENKKEVKIPPELICPISKKKKQEKMIHDPVTLSSGITCDRDALKKEFEGKEFIKCPVTKLKIKKTELEHKSNIFLKNIIENYKADIEKGVQPKPLVEYFGEESTNCPISLMTMEKPIPVSSGWAFDHRSLEGYFKAKRNADLEYPDSLPCPVTKEYLIKKSELDFHEDVTVKKLIVAKLAAIKAEEAKAKAIAKATAKAAAKGKAKVNEGKQEVPIGEEQRTGKEEVPAERESFYIEYNLFTGSPSARRYDTMEPEPTPPASPRSSPRS